MKAFEAWNQKESKCNHECYSGARAKAWRAALEWVQRTVKELDEQDAPICMGDAIKQELEDK